MQPGFASHRFDDVDALGDHLSGWNIEAVQLSPGKLDLTFVTCGLGDVAVSAITCNQLVSARARVDPAWLQVVLLLAPQRWNGFDVEASHLVVLTPGSEHRDLVGEEFRCVELAVRADLAAHIDLAPWLQLHGSRAIIPLDKLTTDEAAGWMNALLTAAASAPAHAIGDEAGPCLRESVIELLYYLRHAAVSAARRPPMTSARVRAARYDVADAALAIIDAADVDAMPPIAAVARSLGITERTLESAFRDVLGTTPLRYCLARRLQWSRRLLVAKSPSRVTDAALAGGFEHFGRFANHYHKLFGERPSETLTRVQRRHLVTPLARTRSRMELKRAIDG